MSKTTPATAFLTRHNIAYELVSYDYDPHAEHIGIQAAEAIGADPATVFKTLMIMVDHKPYVAVLPADKEANMKKLAAVFDGKHAAMLSVNEAEKLTGYKVGGISPFGQRRIFPTVFEESALSHDTIFVNGGGRGLQVRVSPHAVITALLAKTAPFCR